MGTHLKCLCEYHNIFFCREIRKISAFFGWKEHLIWSYVLQSVLRPPPPPHPTNNFLCSTKGGLYSGISLYMFLLTNKKISTIFGWKGKKRRKKKASSGAKYGMETNYQHLQRVITLWNYNRNAVFIVSLWHYRSVSHHLNYIWTDKCLDSNVMASNF